MLGSAMAAMVGRPLCYDSFGPCPSSYSRICKLIERVEPRRLVSKINVNSQERRHGGIEDAKSNMYQGILGVPFPTNPQDS